jgi:hypothetical protein
MPGCLNITGNWTAQAASTGILQGLAACGVYIILLLPIGAN